MSAMKIGVDAEMTTRVNPAMKVSHMSHKTVAWIVAYLGQN